MSTAEKRKLKNEKVVNFEPDFDKTMNFEPDFAKASVK